MEPVGLVTTVSPTTSLTGGPSGPPVVNQKASDSIHMVEDELQNVSVAQEGVGQGSR